MKRCLAVAVLVVVGMAILASGRAIPGTAPQPVAADAWILNVTPVPPVGVIR